jgi:hypothetical protein
VVCIYDLYSFPLWNESDEGCVKVEGRIKFSDFDYSVWAMWFGKTERNTKLPFLIGNFRRGIRFQQNLSFPQILVWFWSGACSMLDLFSVQEEHSAFVLFFVASSFLKNQCCGSV